MELIKLEGAASITAPPVDAPRDHHDLAIEPWFWRARIVDGYDALFEIEHQALFDKRVQSQHAVRAQIAAHAPAAS